MRKFLYLLFFLLLLSTVSAALPDDLPASIPIYPDGDIVNVQDRPGDERRSISFSILVDATIPEINAWYRDAMTQDGWSMKSDQTIAGYTILQSENGELYTSIQAANAEDGLVRISQSILINNSYVYSQDTAITDLRANDIFDVETAEAYPVAEHRTSRSPLRSFLPPRAVPLVATAIGLGLLWFWKRIESSVSLILRKFLSGAFMKKVKKETSIPPYKGFNFYDLRIKYREWLAVGISAVVFALALALSFKNFFLFFFLHILVNCFIYALTTLTRLFMDKHFNMHREYKIWWWGAFVTVFTGFLGNTFSLAGYVVSDKENLKNQGMINLIVSGIFASFSLFFIFLFYSTSAIFFEMSMVLMLTITTIDLLPFEPFSGKAIYAWNKKNWMYVFIPVALLYFFIML